MDGPVSPAVQENGDGCDSLFDLDLDIDGDSGLGFSDWLTLRDGSDGNDDPSKRHEVAVLPLPPPLLTRSSSANGSVDIERDIQELSDLNLRIYRTARTIDTESVDTPLSMSSPSVSQIFDAGCTLTNILSRLAQTAARDAPEASPSAVRCTDTGVALMVLSCHERLIDAFEAMCVAVNSHVQSMTFSPASIMQVMMIAKVISHLLNQVDRAIAPLQGQPHQITAGSSFPSVPNVANSPGEPSSAFQEGIVAGVEQPSECGKTATVVLATMRSRQNRLRAHLKVVKLLVKGSNAWPVT
ncbi:hypothetical protein B0T14DRAFT_568474 [Immersiella caudata]|uniref:Aflatoxin regulatory protein domain-containing protein n=1 Tax=Immersiella caudata TaxID=314043 RepID=A0AA39WK89_9PEZI|nr:hypothetical protein B0T14DRAFT_568474 [Immersiella caudata]